MRGLSPLVVLAVALAGAAHADRRALPDYDGRGNVAKHSRPPALWIPRVLLAPLAFVYEYAIRVPVRAVVRATAHEHLTRGTRQVLGEHDKLGFAPIVHVESELAPFAGLYAHGDHLFVQGNSARVLLATGGLDWTRATIVDRYTPDAGTTEIAARFDDTRRPDLLYFGLGPDVTRATRTRYGVARVDGGLELRRGPVAIGAGVCHVGYRTGRGNADPGLPPGFADPYTAAYQRATLALDTRAPAPDPGSGAFLHVTGETDLAGSDGAWAAYGVTAGAAADLTGHHRVVALELGVDFVDPLRAGDRVPFTALAQLGSDRMAGFVDGWMLGRSTFVSRLSYTWPVLFSLDGEAHLALGNAFGDHLAGLTTQRLRVSGDVGIKTTGHRDLGLELLVGVGSEPIEDGAHVTSARIALGMVAGL